MMQEVRVSAGVVAESPNQTRMLWMQSATSGTISSLLSLHPAKSTSAGRAPLAARQVLQKGRDTPLVQYVYSTRTQSTNTRDTYVVEMATRHAYKQIRTAGPLQGNNCEGSWFI
jgi:hypothetical protein